jgi:hypothetical protein
MAPAFRKMGLLWDEPELKDEEFVHLLRDSKNPKRIWALGRLLERAPLAEVCKLFNLKELEEIIRIVRIRPEMMRAWKHAIEYWRKTT